jgi:hypothetical protein
MPDICSFSKYFLLVAAMSRCDRMTTPLGNYRTKLCFLFVNCYNVCCVVFIWLLFFTALARIHIVMHHFKSTHVEIYDRWGSNGTLMALTWARLVKPSNFRLIVYLILIDMPI